MLLLLAGECHVIRRHNFLISVFGLTAIGLVPGACAGGLDGYDFTLRYGVSAVSGQVFAEARDCPTAALCGLVEYHYGFIDDLTIDDPSAVTDIYYRTDILQQAVMGRIRYRFGQHNSFFGS